MIKQRFFVFVFKKIDKVLTNKKFKFSFLSKIRNYMLAQIIPYPNQIKIEYGIINLLPRGKVSRDLTLYRVFEKDETELIKNLIQDGDVVLDVGANIGYYTMIFSKLVGKKGRVYSFEPGLENFGILEKNISTNQLQNVILEKLAISNISEEAKLYLSEGPGGHRIQHSNYCTEIFENVKTITLDQYFKNNLMRQKISFVKLDVEGGELKVLQGMKSLLNNKNIKILVELYGPFIREFGSEPEELFFFLRSQGFKIYFCKKKYHENPLTINNIQELMIPDEKRLNFESYDQNFLCIKEN